MPGKVRGIDCKLFLRKIASTGGIFAADPSGTAAPTATDFDEVTTVNNVEQSLQSNEYGFETRESPDDITIPTDRSRDLTISIYEDASDPFYVRFWQASRASALASKVLGLVYCNVALASTPILGTAGNFTVTQEDWSEPKKEGKLVKFKLKPYTHVVDFYAAGS